VKSSLPVIAAKSRLPDKQGDQIVYVGHFFENYRSSPNFLATPFHRKSNVLIFTKDC
jgi:hypothetical protein